MAHNDWGRHYAASAEPGRRGLGRIMMGGRERGRLSGRQAEFLVIGGTAGSGLFLGAGVGIDLAGPFMLLAFLIAGAMALVVTRSLGQMALAEPGTPTFVNTTATNLGRHAAFVQGWSYWLCTLLTCMAELTAVGLLARPWLPGMPAWGITSLALLLLLAFNSLSARAFGEVEFWMSASKVAIVVLLIAACLLLPLLGPTGVARGETGCWTIHLHSAHGLTGFIQAMPLALFAFGGIELIGLAGPEMDDPRRTLPPAINAVVLRLTLMYAFATLALLVTLSCGAGPRHASPFTAVLDGFGIPGAEALMDGILVLVILSSANACLFGGLRVLKALAASGYAPARLATENAAGAPWSALVASAAAIAVAILLQCWLPQRTFVLLLTASASIGLLNWAVFVVAHQRFRASRRMPKSSVRGPPVSPWSGYATLLLIALVICVVGTGTKMWLSSAAMAFTLGVLTLVSHLVIGGKAGSRRG